MSLRRLAPVVAVALLAVGCVSNAPATGGAGAIDVESTATSCSVARTETPSGTITFSVRNTGDEVTEFYLLAEDGLRVISLEEWETIKKIKLATDQDANEYDQEKIDQSRGNAIRSHSRELGMILGVDKADIVDAILSALPEQERKRLQSVMFAGSPT